MRVKRYRFLVTSFVFFLLIPILVVSQANPPSQQTAAVDYENSLIVVYPKQDAFPINSIFALHFHILNGTGHFIHPTKVNCSIHVYNETNNHIFSRELLLDSNSVDVYQKINISDIGHYSYIVWCNSTVTNAAGFLSTSFEVTQDGNSWDNSQYPMALVLGLVAGMFFLVVFGKNITVSDNNGNFIKVNAFTQMFLFATAGLMLYLLVQLTYGFAMSMPLQLRTQMEVLYKFFNVAYPIIGIVLFFGWLGNILFNTFRHLDYTMRGLKR